MQRLLIYAAKFILFLVASSDNVACTVLALFDGVRRRSRGESVDHLELRQCAVWDVFGLEKALNSSACLDVEVFSCAARTYRYRLMKAIFGFH
jgi:hypothetical protein